MGFSQIFSRLVNLGAANLMARVHSLLRITIEPAGIDPWTDPPNWSNLTRLIVAAPGPWPLELTPARPLT